MRYAIIADIHGNLEALEAVLEDIKNESIDKIYCLGDIVGYYPDPNACIKIIREISEKTVLGNHDDAALGNIDIEKEFSIYARLSMAWTREQLTEESIRYLHSLEMSSVVDGEILMVHSNPYRPQNWSYLHYENPGIIAKSFSSLREKVCFVGHTHVPQILIRNDDDISLSKESRIQLKPQRYYIVNSGSVGQPRDKNPKSSYAVYDNLAQEVYIKRVDYDFKKTEQKSNSAGLPEYLSKRLSAGR